MHTARRVQNATMIVAALVAVASACGSPSTAGDAADTTDVTHDRVSVDIAMPRDAMDTTDATLLDTGPRDAAVMDASPSLDAGDVARPFDDVPNGTDVRPLLDATSSDARVDGGSPDVTRSDGAVCVPSTFADPDAPARAACTFGPGAMVADTIGDATMARARIQHVILVMEENHSLDNMYGTTGHGIEGIPAGYTNPGTGTATVAPYHLTTGCPADIGHSTAAILAEWDNGRMDGFFRTDGMVAMGYYNDADHPFYTWAMTTFATSDRYFCGTLGATGPNRQFFYAAQASSTAPTLMAQLTGAGIAFYDYIVPSGQAFNNTYGTTFMSTRTRPYSQMVTDLASGALPAVSYVELGAGLEHPPYSVHTPEGTFRDLMTHVFASPVWSSTAVIFTYDEGGGFFDHVPPPSTCNPTTGATTDRLGIRVPAMVISPWARTAFVSHRVHSHTSVVRFVQLLHNLPALTRRDANSDAMLDLFDFGCPSFATPPAPLPAAHAPGC